MFPHIILKQSADKVKTSEVKVVSLKVFGSLADSTPIKDKIPDDSIMSLRFNWEERRGRKLCRQPKVLQLY